MTIQLALVCLAIGLLVGAVGIGGMLLPSALSVGTGIAIHQGMATALLTFVFTGLAGTLAFQRRGSIDWTLARPLTLGVAATAWAGAWTSSLLDAPALSLTLAALIVAAGLYTLHDGAAKRATAAATPAPTRRRWLLLAAAGAATGFVSGLTGVGGPVLSVPLMLALGFPVLASIGVGQVVQVVGALSGTAANLSLGTIDFELAAQAGAFEIAGVVAGAALIHRVDLRLAQRCVAALCIVAGMAFMLRGAALY
ncbi:sulfite exporter TauE/SafE family protein [Pseudoduganella namucuonensis]|uniref:Probable membrane transporter protein n=1 Tax=Pseudoduganella namucuonensis TaxID=1035707 RepID=A0A1I7IP80_9BURK|nr:sulfite exporter TauE/SafE family protein [Pseudoduganella namucuonensis]SFU74745.1 hypothetical protein SAMN05216552_1008192 [Pseudoduganella namucuonensis]